MIGAANIGLETCEISMNAVLCVPDLAVNVFSLSRMCQMGYSVTFTKETCKVVSPTNEVVAIGQETGGLYKFKEDFQGAGQL